MRSPLRAPFRHVLAPLFAAALAVGGCAAGDELSGGGGGAAGGGSGGGEGAGVTGTGVVVGGAGDSTGGPLVPPRALLVVAQENERGVAFVDVDRRKVIALTRVGWAPREVALSPDRSQAYVVNYSGDRFGAGSISVLSLRDRREIDRIDLYPYGAFHGLVPAPNGVDLYVASETRRSVLRVNLASRQIDHTWVLPHGSPHLMALDRTETHLFVTDSTGPYLFAINLATGDVQEVHVGEAPEAVTLAPDASALWVANSGDGTISALDPYSLIPIATFAAGKDPVRIAFDDDMRRAVVVNAGEGSLMVFDARTRARLATVPVGLDPVGLAMEPDGSRAYVASTRDDAISIVDLGTNTVTGTVQVGLLPSGMALVELAR